MIWRYWPIRALQDEVGEALLERIEEILPLVDPSGGLFFKTDKKSLVRLLGSFASEDYFRKSENVEKCLNYLNPEKFFKLRVSLGLPDCLMDERSIRDTALSISKSKKYSDIFFEMFEIPGKFRLLEPEVKPNIFIAQFPAHSHPVEVFSSFKALKDYQCDVFFRALDSLSPPMARLIVQMPTGSGKTRTAMEIISNHISQDECEPTRVIWLANSRELCEQAIACFEDVWRHVGRVGVDVQRIWGDYPKPKEAYFTQHAQFLVASFQTLWQLISKADGGLIEVLGKTTLLIIDEAHISVAPTYSKVVREVARRSLCRIVGLTATPGRTDELEVGELADLFHGEILSLRDPKGEYSNSIAYLRSKGVLSRVCYEPLLVEEGVKLSQKEIDKLEREFDFPESVLKKVGQSNIRSAEIIVRLMPYLKANAKIILFAPSIESSKFLTSMFTFLGVNAAHIDGATGDQARAKVTSEFVDGEVQILCNYGVLTTGFDAPKTDVVCIARPTKSPVLYSQMIGRGLRGPAVGGTENCTIVEVRDNFLNLGTQDELYNHFNVYWEQ